MNKISIVGLGYIGLPTALIAAKHFTIQGFDVDEHKINLISNGICPIIEPGLDELLTKAINSSSFHVGTNLLPADCFVIAVPTPVTKNKKSDLSYVFTAGKAIAKQLQPGNVIILESTVPVGTTQKLSKLIEEHSGLTASKDFYIAYCPERVAPGKTIHELIHNDRVIGGICPESATRAKTFYEAFVKGNLCLTDDKTAEMVKLVENSTRDVQIALANQISQMCKTANINPFEVIELANKHPQINLLQPGCGVGGHCIAIDPWFLIESFPDSSELLQTARAINDKKPHIVIDDVITCAKRFLQKHKRKPKVIALGLTFKPDVDDLRQSPALLIARELGKQKELLDLSVYDHFVSEEKITSFGLQNRTCMKSAVDEADIVLILVKHTLFKNNLNVAHKITINTCGL